MARKTGLKGLQEWAKHVTQGYRDVEITNMTTSFRNGLAFCAIIHHFHPDLITFHKLNKENVFENNQLAFSVAERELDIPALLDAEDMVALAVPDKLSVATYLVQYYNHFKDKALVSSALAPSGGINKALAGDVVNKAFPSGGVNALPGGGINKSQSSLKRTNVSSPALLLSSKENVLTQPQAETNIPRERRSKFKKPESSEVVAKGHEVCEEHGTLKRGTMGREVCEVCGERVFLMERLGVENRVFHRSCFQCNRCLVALKPGSYEYDSASGKFYCQQHYRQTVREQTIKRTMAERGISPTDVAMTPVKPKRSKKFKREPSQPEKAEHSPSNCKNENLTQSEEVKAGLPSLLKSLAASKLTQATSEHTIVSVQSPTKQSVPSAKSLVRSNIPAKPSPPCTNIPAKPPPPSLATASSSASKTGSNAIKTSSSAVETSLAASNNNPLIQQVLTKPATQTANNAVKQAVPHRITAQTNLTATSKTVYTGPVKPSRVKRAELDKSSQEGQPVKPPRCKKASPEVENAPIKRGSIKPKRPAPPRPSQPPVRQNIGMEGRVLTEKRQRRAKLLRQQLDEVEREQVRLEHRGVELEQQLRENEEAEDGLVEEWFSLVNDRNLLLRRESDLVYELKDLELIEQHEALDTEIRRRLARNDSVKSDLERLEEEAMITELVELVERRDKLLWTLHLEKTQDEEEDRQVELITSTQMHKPTLRNKSLSFM